MTLSIWGHHDGHACGYYRVRLPLAQLELAGHHVGTSHGTDPRSADYRIVIGQRVGKVEALPIWRRMAAKHRLVYETDDDVFSIDPSNTMAYLTHDEETKDATEFAATAAHMVTVSTDHLAEVMSKYNPNVVVLKNRIDGALLDLERPRRDRVTVGWAGGDSHVRDFDMVSAQLRRFLERNPRVDFHNIGSNYLKVFRLPGRHTGWQQDLFDYYRGIDFDIGIAPLADTVFNRSKSAIKAIEYGALGIPVVASDVGPYRDYVIDGKTGYLVRSEHEWGKRLYELVNDEAMRAEMGAAAKEEAARWTIQQGWPEWERAYRSLI